MFRGFGTNFEAELRAVEFISFSYNFSNLDYEKVLVG
jgi:hypothetical protein